MPKRNHYGKVILVFIIILVFCAVLFGSYRLLQTYNAAKNDLKSSNEKASDLDALLSQAEYEKSELSDALYATQVKMTQYETQVQDLSRQVGNYHKLETLDPELLQKYSKVYFLSEHYSPSSVTNIGAEYTSPKGKIIEIHTSVWPFLQRMLDDANGSADLSLRVVSGYRSYKTQQALKTGNIVQYGTGANRFSADQGYSEHQLGTTVDLTTVKTGNLSIAFESSPEFKWLIENAHKYGFTLSYPKNNKYYIYEPWHWRFVGIQLASQLHEDDKHLYDLEQRDIDTYLLRIFD